MADATINQSAPIMQNRGRAWIAAVIILVVLVLVALGSFYFLVIKQNQSPAVYTSVSILPASQLYKVDSQKATITPVTAPGQTKGTVVIDEVRNAKVTYYLITDSSQITSNVYESLKGGAITPVTSSQTFKYDLSYDASVNTLAYLSGTIKNQQDLFEQYLGDAFTVTTAVPGTNGKVTTENILTTGAQHVELVPNGNMAIIAKTDGLYAYMLSGGRLQKIYTNPTAAQMPFATGADGAPIVPNLAIPKTPFAVSSTGTLALYNATTHAIDMYNVAKGINGLSYLSSEKAAFAPSAMAFEGSQLILGQEQMSGKNLMSALSIPGITSPVTFMNPDQTLQQAVPQEIRYE